MCALYALCAGAAAHRHYNCKKSKSRSGTVNDNKTVYISLEALALSAVSTSERQFHNKNKECDRCDRDFMWKKSAANNDVKT